MNSELVGKNENLEQRNLVFETQVAIIEFCCFFLSLIQVSMSYYIWKVKPPPFFSFHAGKKNSMSKVFNVI